MPRASANTSSRFRPTRGNFSTSCKSPTWISSRDFHRRLRQTGGHHRLDRQRQIVARVRHHLCRGPAQIRRVAFGLRAAISRPAAKARRGFHRGTFTGDCDKLVVITGLTGSDKSSLAFDTIYAEGQRKYVESLSAYARQFLDQLQKPDVDFIEGLSPAIAIEQRSSGSSPRSIIATTTEVYDYLRLLYAHIGQAHCPDTGVPISTQSTSDIVDKILALPPKTKVM